MGIATISVAPPASVNAQGAHSSRGSNIGRHKRKKALEADLAILLLAAAVPRPIPGDRVRATAHIEFPVLRGRDEDNYRGALAKSLGDALDPHDPNAPLRWLSNDTPEHFTFGAVTFGQTEFATWTGAGGKIIRRRKPAMAHITLVWGDDLAAELERELHALKAANA